LVQELVFTVAISAKQFNSAWQIFQPTHLVISTVCADFVNDI